MKAAGIRRLAFAPLAVLALSMSSWAGANGLAVNALAKVTNSADRAALANITIGDDSLEIPALSQPYIITLHAYSSGKGGDDKSNADLRLFVNEARVAYRHDDSFDTYDLDVRQNFVSKKGEKSYGRYEHTNNIATEHASGLEVIDIRPF